MREVRSQQGSRGVAWYSLNEGDDDGVCGGRGSSVRRSMWPRQ